MKHRLTTDNPTNNFQTLMNYCYAKDSKATLVYADGDETVDLCEYTAKCCQIRRCSHITADSIMEDLLNCDCPIAIMYHLGVQAAELRGRLKHYEDLEEQSDINLAPRVNGQWKDVFTDNQYFSECTICGEYSDWDELPNFCPNCGADMRGVGS